MSKQIPRTKTESEIFYPIELKQMTDKETREYHLKRLKYLSDKSLGETPQIGVPNKDEKKLIKSRRLDIHGLGGTGINV